MTSVDHNTGQIQIPDQSDNVTKCELRGNLSPKYTFQQLHELPLHVFGLRLPLVSDLSPSTGSYLFSFDFRSNTRIPNYNFQTFVIACIS